jgi:hypothetical protein
VADFMKDVVEMSDYAFRRLMDRMDGITDDEYLWEPAADCWSIRRRDDGTFHGDWGLVFDETPPVTTIAWRTSHIVDCLSSERSRYLLELEPRTPVLAEGVPGTASLGLDMLRRAYDHWHDCITSADHSKLLEKQGPIGGIWAEYSRLGFVLHIIDELVHHAAEIGVLRDMYRAAQEDDFVIACLHADRDAVDAMRRDDAGIVQRKIAEHPDLMTRAAATGWWDAIPLLLELGFAVDGSSGRGPLHHAAGDNQLELMRLLIDAGASLEAEDPIYHATPLGWAEYFNRAEAVELLRSLEATPA